MSKRSSLFSLGVLCGLTLAFSELQAADKGPDISKLPPPASDKKGLTFDADIKPMLEKSCMKCHSGDRPKSKYRMTTVAELVKGGSSGDKAVEPGASEKSPIIHYVAGAIEEMEMPPIDNRDKYPALTKEQIGILRAWIDQGAK